MLAIAISGKTRQCQSNSRLPVCTSVCVQMHSTALHGMKEQPESIMLCFLYSTALSEYPCNFLWGGNFMRIKENIFPHNVFLLPFNSIQSIQASILAVMRKLVTKFDSPQAKYIIFEEIFFWNIKITLITWGAFVYTEIWIFYLIIH